MNQFFKSRLKIPLLLLFICIVAYLPLSSFLFALKNDAFAFNFPNKYFFSEAIRNGYLPTWNPYLNFGFPLYADPGFAWWSPITWIFGLIGYNVYTFSIEVLTYIYLAGLGMYWLCTKLRLTHRTSFAIGSMFMCSGFFVGNLQHINFLTCAAFLPWLAGSWLLYQKDSTLKNLLKCCISSYLLCTGGHPAIPIATMFFFLVLTLLYYAFLHLNNRSKAFFITQGKLLISIFLILTPLLFSYWNLLSFYSRTGPVNQTENSITGFTIPSYISFLYPFATAKDNQWFGTDVSMRNIYFSIPGFLFFVVFLLRKQKEKLQYIFLITGLLMLVVSLGGSIKETIYDHLPFFSWIRTNGEFRVFAIFSFLLCGAFELDIFFKVVSQSSKQFKRLLNLLIILSLTGCIFLLFSERIFFLPPSSITTVENIKNLIDNVSFKQSFLISLIITILLSAAYLYVLKKQRNRDAFITVLCADIIINCWLLLPITGIGKTSVAELQKIISKSPEGFPSPLLEKNKSDYILSPDERRLIASSSWYDKKIIHPKIDYPSEFKATEKFYESSDTAIISGKHFIFLKNKEVNSLSLIKFTPTFFEIKLNIAEPDTLIVLQNYFPGWKATVNDTPTSVVKYLATFISIPVNKRVETVKLEFCPFNY